MLRDCHLHENIYSLRFGTLNLLSGIMQIIMVVASNAASRRWTGQQGTESPQKSLESYSHANQSSFGVEERLEVATTLARLLKNNHENTTIDEHHVSQFIDLGKEVCWSFNKGGHERWLDLISKKCSSEGHTFALDGCPRYWHPSHARTIVKHYPDEARFLMLVRNPIDRLVSHLNDQYGWRGGSAKLPEGFIDKVAKKMAKQQVSRKAGDVFGLSLFGRNLRNLLQVVNDPKQVLVIQMDAMKRDPQQVMDNVMDHIGGHRMKRVDAIHANNGKSKGVYEYQFVSDETTEELQEIFTNDVKLLESLLGRTFPWSWTKNSTMVEQETSWLTTYPNLQIAVSSN